VSYEEKKFEPLNLRPGSGMLFKNKRKKEDKHPEVRWRDRDTGKHDWSQADLAVEEDFEVWQHLSEHQHQRAVEAE
jgi:hypothetical protein